MADGASLVAPETVWFAWDTVLGRDVTVEQNVVFGPGVTVADNVVIHAFGQHRGRAAGKRRSGWPLSRGCGRALCWKRRRVSATSSK